jgi:hypothetical protein
MYHFFFHFFIENYKPKGFLLSVHWLINTNFVNVSMTDGYYNLHFIYFFFVFYLMFPLFIRGSTLHGHPQVYFVL